MREQVCIYMCPWPRIQAAMLDEDSLIVTYQRLARRAARQAPQGRGRESRGDCIDCNACVAVCPMGIDIRDGQQLECITCALCIDACDDVMDKIGKPRGLIDYSRCPTRPRERAGRRRATIWRTSSGRAPCLYRAVAWSGVGLTLAACSPATEIDLKVAARPQPDLRARCPTARSATATR